MRFSIITPFYVADQDRADKFQACIKSIEAQVYNHEDFEHILINDGSVFEFDIPKYPWIKVINQPNLGRIEAFNNGLRNAKGEIITFLDSDDEYTDTYLGVVDWLYLSNPGFKMFNFGNIFLHKDGGENERGPFKPRKRKVGHQIFAGGNIVNGTFVFHRDIYKDLGGYPPFILENVDCTDLNYPQYEGQPEPYVRTLCSASPYDFSAMAQTEFPEISKFFMEKHPDHPKLLVKELGNPFGNDFYLFYKYTRKYWSKPVNKYLLKVHLK
jgi:glycosyltransferase involved in cell wall biosynthesis